MRSILSRILLALYALNIVLAWLHFAIIPHVLDGEAQIAHRHHVETTSVSPDNSLCGAHDHHHGHHDDSCRVMEFFSQYSVVIAASSGSLFDHAVEPELIPPISRDIVLADLFRTAPKQSPPLFA